MSTAADKARAKAARLASGRPASVPEPAKPVTSPEVAAGWAGEPDDDLPPMSRSGRTRPVRMTVDLAPALHAEFDDWANKTGRDYQLGRSIRADIFRVLLRKLMADPQLQAEVIKTLRRERRR